MVGFLRALKSLLWDVSMVMHAGCELQKQRPLSTASYLPLRKHRKNKKHNNNQHVSRDFFKLAAALASPTIETGPAASLSSPSDTQDDLFISALLDKSHQEKSALFAASNDPLCATDADYELLSTAFNKLQHICRLDMPFEESVFLWRAKKKYAFLFQQPKRDVSIEGVHFTKRELCSLLQMHADELNNILFYQDAKRDGPISVLAAVDFHHRLLEFFKKTQQHPVIFLGNKDLTERSVLVDRVRQFSSHRLHMKSLQMRSGADPDIRYFHAAFRTSVDASERIDILYWLRINEQQIATEGAFIEQLSANWLPKLVFCPQEMINNLCKKDITSSLEALRARLLITLLRLYLTSTAIEEDCLGEEG